MFGVFKPTVLILLDFFLDVFLYYRDKFVQGFYFFVCKSSLKSSLYNNNETSQTLIFPGGHTIRQYFNMNETLFNDVIRYMY